MNVKFVKIHNRLSFSNQDTAKDRYAGLMGRCWRLKWQSRAPPTSRSRRVFVLAERSLRISRTTRAATTAAPSRPRLATIGRPPARRNSTDFRGRVLSCLRSCWEDLRRGWLAHRRIETWVRLSCFDINCRLQYPGYISPIFRDSTEISMREGREVSSRFVQRIYYRSVWCIHNCTLSLINEFLWRNLIFSSILGAFLVNMRQNVRKKGETIIDVLNLQQKLNKAIRFFILRLVCEICVKIIKFSES